ncbi:sporulation protein [Scopulibacillus cellulosilyticus]|uniref:Sporulation protein n=1 Tax=Scopulibacillus cellulosilyticus TaxID=2665665 RepID=A0ABW2PSJ6_9BACL
MDYTLDYLKESLSNWVDRDDRALNLFHKIENHQFPNEEAFVEVLSEEETEYLHDVLRKEMAYAKNEQDEVRYSQLSDVFEQLI